MIVARSHTTTSVELALDALGPQPPNFGAIVEINRGPLRRQAADADPLTPRQVEQSRGEGALIVDAFLGGPPSS